MPPWQPPPAAPPTSAPKRTRRRVIALLTVGVVVAVVAICGNYSVRKIGETWANIQKAAADDRLGDTVGGTGGTGTGSSGVTTSGELVRVGQPITLGGGAKAVGVSGATVYYAQVIGANTEVVAMNATDGKQLWKKSVAIAGSDLDLIVLDELLVMDVAQATTNDRQDTRAVLQRSDGAMVWSVGTVWSETVAFFGSDAVIEYKGIGLEDYKLYRVDLKTGKDRWKRNNIADTLPIDDHRAEPVRTWVGDGGPAKNAGMLEPSAYRLHDSFTASPESMVQLTDDLRIQVVDVATGATRGQSGPNAVPIEDEFWTAFDNQVIGLLNAEAAGLPTVAGYGLSDFTQKWKLPLEAGETVEQVKPCGEHLVCVAVDSSNDNYRTVAVDTATGKQAWTQKTESGDDDAWYVTPKGMIWGNQFFDTMTDSKLLGFDGKEVAALGDANVYAVRDGRVLTANSSYQNNAIGWVAQVADIATGEVTRAAEIGTQMPEKAALAGDIAVLIDDKGVLKVFQVKG